MKEPETKKCPSGTVLSSNRPHWSQRTPFQLLASPEPAVLVSNNLFSQLFPSFEVGLIDRYTVRELLLEMETLTQVRYSGKYGQILTEITKPQRLIMESLKVSAPA